MPPDYVEVLQTNPKVEVADDGSVYFCSLCIPSIIQHQQFLNDLITNILDDLLDVFTLLTDLVFIFGDAIVPSLYNQYVNTMPMVIVIEIEPP